MSLLRAASVGVVLYLASPAAAQSTFVRGDVNADGDRDVADAVGIILCTFLGSPCTTCADAADVNDDGIGDISDPIFLLGFLFTGGSVPPPPGACGLDPSGDALECAAFAPCSDPDAVPTSRGLLKVTPIEHATLALEWDGKTIYVDPVGGAANFQGLPAPDILLVTDIHGDHMDRATLRAVLGESTVLVVPGAVSQALASAGGVPGAEERVLANGQSIEVDGIGIEAVPMYNLTASRLQYHSKGRGNGYVLDLAGTRVYISGDTEDIPEMRALPDIAVAFLCMNLPFTMTPQQAASATLQFQPRIVYPYHYRGQDTQQFRALVEDGSDGIEVRLRNWYP